MLLHRVAPLPRVGRSGQGSAHHGSLPSTHLAKKQPGWARREPRKQEQSSLERTSNTTSHHPPPPGFFPRFGSVAAMARPRGTPSTGRHRIEMSLRPDKTSRQVTFSKRRSGLFKKCSELSLVCGADVVCIVFSEAGNLFALGSPSVDAVLRRYAPLHAPVAAADDDAGVDDDREALEEVCRAREVATEQVAAESARMDLIGDEVVKAQGGRRFWWEADTEALGEAELPEFARALGRLRDNVSRHVDKMARRAPAPATAAVAHAEDAASNYLYLAY
uniref:Uncharacterized protein n=1 Tax=Avena sativa TaxID=4498 RepID=A0ACD5YJF0_AVESA